MKYLCLIYGEEQWIATLPPRELNAVGGECAAYGEELKRGGYLLASHRLQSVETATTVRVRSGKVTVTDGPFAETQEQLGGFYLIDARDLNEAIQLAAKIPPARFGSVEVRPIDEVLESMGRNPSL